MPLPPVSSRASLHPIGFGVIDRSIGTEFQCELALGLRAGRRNDFFAGAKQLGNLHRVGADAAAGRLNQNGFARPQVSAIDKRLECGSCRPPPVNRLGPTSSHPAEE